MILTATEYVFVLGFCRCGTAMVSPPFRTILPTDVEGAAFGFLSVQNMPPQSFDWIVG